MSGVLGSAWEEVFRRVDDRTIALPSLVRGRLVLPPTAPPGEEPSTGSHILKVARRDPRSGAPTGAFVRILLPHCSPGDLLEDRPHELAGGLYALPMTEVFSFLAELRRVVERGHPAVDDLLELLGGIPGMELASARDFFRYHLPALLDPEGLTKAIDRELGEPGIAGTDFLDGWVELDTQTHAGGAARAAQELLGVSVGPDHAVRAAVRAMPTRQLHITAGNSPFIPVVSWLRGLATKGAVVVKTPSDAVVVGAVLGSALREIDPDHPITRHTSFVYWPGGDRAMEEVLFQDHAFDRIVVWGSEGTVRSVRERVGLTRTVFMNPRYGLSFVGRGAFATGPEGLEEVAARASADVMIANQRACTSSILTFVEGSEEEALAFCEALAGALAAWDRRFPQNLPRSVVGQLRLLKRGPLIRGAWFINGEPPEIRSAVVLAREPFDLADHPLNRFVVVRRVDDLSEGLPHVTPAVSTVGVYPDGALRQLRDSLAASGVSGIFALGECERTFAGMPHDGMRVLGELVNWTTAGGRAAASQGGLL